MVRPILRNLLASVFLVGSFATQAHAASPVLKEVKPLKAFNYTTPKASNYTFNSSDAGMIAYAGGCTSTVTTAVIGKNTVSLKVTKEGVYDLCAITVTNAQGEAATLTISPFVYDKTPPVVGELFLGYRTGALFNKNLDSSERELIYMPVEDSLSGIDPDSCTYLDRDGTWKPAYYDEKGHFCYVPYSRMIRRSAWIVMPGDKSDMKVSDAALNLAKGIYHGDLTSTNISASSFVSVCPSATNQPCTIRFTSDFAGKVNFYDDHCPGDLTTIVKGENIVKLSPTAEGKYLHHDCSFSVTVEQITRQEQCNGDVPYYEQECHEVDVSDKVDRMITPPPFTYDKTAPVVGSINVTPSTLSDGKVLVDPKVSTVTLWASADDSLTGIDGKSCQFTVNGGKDWKSADYDPLLRRCVLGGMKASDLSQVGVKVSDNAQNKGSPAMVSVSISTASTPVKKTISPSTTGKASRPKLKVFLRELTPVRAITSDATPEYKFRSNVDGTVSYKGDCDSDVTSVTAGENVITFKPLSVGTHGNCIITVTDSLNRSVKLKIKVFRVIKAPTIKPKKIIPTIKPLSEDEMTPAEPNETAPALTPLELKEVVPVPTVTSDISPEYTFSSSVGGKVTYSGDCSTDYPEVYQGENTLTFNEMTEGLHDNCELTVTSGSQSQTLKVSPFTIDTNY